jgi:hypothetical protein
MPESREPETFRICFEAEVVGTGEEVLAALALNARERHDPLVGPSYITAHHASLGSEEALTWIVDALQIEAQVRRVLHPLAVNPVNGGLRLDRLNSDAPGA